MTHFDGLIRTTIVSYTDKRFPVGKQLTMGVYVMMDITPSFQYIFNRYKIVERHENYVMLSRLKNGKWNEPSRRNIRIINGVEAIDGWSWTWIKPNHKLDTLFTKQEWETLSIEEKCKRYKEA